MEKIILPDLYCPFPLQINKHVDVLEEYALEWVLRFNLLENESRVYQRFSKSNFFLLTAYAYPHCQLEELKIANDWLSWLFIWDDQCDMSELGKQPEILKDYQKRFLEIFNGIEPTSQDIPLSHALSDIRKRMLQIGDLISFDRVVRSFEGYFHGCMLEAFNRLQGIVPDVNTYTKMRRLSVAGDLVLAWIDFFNHLTIPDVVKEQTIVSKLGEMTSNIISWCNDIFSASREMASGDFHNLVLVFHYQQKLPLEEAIKRCVDMHNQEVQAMIDLEASIPHFGEELDAELEKYILGLNAWISANLNWYADSARYQSLEKLELMAA